MGALFILCHRDSRDDQYTEKGEMGDNRIYLALAGGLLWQRRIKLFVVRIMSFGRTQMRLPAKVTIYGKEYKVVKDPTRNGARVCESTNVIEIGTLEKGRILNNFLHEVIELIFVENFCRYDNHYAIPGDKDIVFVFDHRDLENIVPQIAVAIKGILKDG